MTEEIELGRLKGVPGTLRRPLPFEQEANVVLGSPYHLWWRCLRASAEYLQCCDADGKDHELSDTFEKFGDVRLGWRTWWQFFGRDIFSEREDYPQVREITSKRELNQLRIDVEKFLILDIPLGLRRVTILEKINELLDQRHLGRDLNVWEQSSAKIKLHKSDLQDKTIPKLVEVAEILHRHPDIQLYELADMAQLATIHLGRAVNEQLTDREERQRREMAASRYKTQAQKLVHYAVRGIFPCVKDPI
jgi:hypothetical protein